MAYTYLSKNELSAFRFRAKYGVILLDDCMRYNIFSLKNDKFKIRK